MSGTPSLRAAVVLAMINSLAPRERSQLAHRLHGQLTHRPSAAEERLRELLPLAQMLDEQARRDDIPPAVGGGRSTWKPSPARRSDRFPVVAQEEYDRRRPSKAPAGQELAARFGNWILACRAVYGLRPDGRYSGISKPWTNGTRGKKRPATYTREEALAAIRECALAYGRRPTSNLYIEWSARRRAHARACGSTPPRLPAYSHYRDNYAGWPRALAPFSE